MNYNIVTALQEDYNTIILKDYYNKGVQVCISLVGVSRLLGPEARTLRALL
jgi:hypothetical protein